jgi:hypothetical protein
MKVLAWIFLPVFMVYKWMLEDDKDGLGILFVPIIAILQIVYWYVIFNFPVVFGLVPFNG